MADFFPPDAVIRRVMAEPAIWFGAGRALLMQLAHPAVAQGVADHSDFKKHPFKRLIGTFEAMSAVVFGTEELAAGVGKRIRWIHERVTGPDYRANDPANLLWVHATLIDSALVSYSRLVRPMHAEDVARLYEEGVRAAEVFGCPRDAQPATYTQFTRYVDEMVRTLRVTDVGRELGRDIVNPPLATPLKVALAPALAVHRLATIGTTPAPLREQFGFAWDERAERRLARVMRLAATTRKAPRPLRTAPMSLASHVLKRRAARNVARFEARVVSG